MGRDNLFVMRVHSSVVRQGSEWECGELRHESPHTLVHQSQTGYMDTYINSTEKNYFSV